MLPGLSTLNHHHEIFLCISSLMILMSNFPHCRLQEILEIADDMAIDIPHIWLYLAEIITPMLQEGGIPMGQLFRLGTESDTCMQDYKPSKQKKIMHLHTI